MAAISLSSLSFTPQRPTISFSRLASSSSCFFTGRPLRWGNREVQQVSLSSATRMNEKISARRSRRAVVVAACDYYSILEVPVSASREQIKAAYTKLVKQYHPAVNEEPRATQKFKDISAAYDVLSDHEERALYDQYGEAGLKDCVDGSRRQMGIVPADISQEIVDCLNGRCLLSEMHTDSRSRIVLYHMTLEFSEAVVGAEKELKLSRLEPCEVCGGTGAQAGSKVKICSTCSGKDLVLKSEQTSFGTTSRHQPEDIYVYLHLIPCSTISISYPDAILGTTVQVEGTTEVQILPAAQPRSVITSANCDHLFTVKVSIPEYIR